MIGLSLLLGWLKGRRQRVKNIVYVRAFSDWLIVLSGVSVRQPQGSVFARILFLIFINDLDFNKPYIKVCRRY